MIYLLWGEDKYRLEKRFNQLVRPDENSLNLIVYDHDFDFAKIKNEAETIPFLSNKKIVVLKAILASKNKKLIDDLTSWLKDVPSQTDLLFVEDSLDQRLSIVKTIREVGKIEEYNLLKPYEVTKWIKEKVEKLGGKISNQDAEKLSLMLGNDLIKNENEIKKLLAYSLTIDKDSIDELITPEFNDSIFTLMDAICDKNSKKAFGLLNSFLENNEEEVYLLTMLIRQVRNLLIIKAVGESGRSESEIAKITGLHPFVVKKTLVQSKNFTEAKLNRMHEQLVKVDSELKNSNIGPKVILTRLILSFMAK